MTEDWASTHTESDDPKPVDGLFKDEVLKLVLNDDVVIESTDILEVQKALLMDDKRYDPLMRGAGKSLVARLLILMEFQREDAEKFRRDLAKAINSTSSDAKHLLEVAEAVYERALKAPEGPVGIGSSGRHVPDFYAAPTKARELDNLLDDKPEFKKDATPPR